MSLSVVQDRIQEPAAWRSSLVAASPAMVHLLDLVERIGPFTIPVLILGETGTGKEVIAQALHAASRRASGPLVSINCPALPATLAESELFGHARGAFTGAERSSQGLIRAADKGTLLLDEIGDLDLTVQAKLLRVLEDGRVRMVGGTAETPVDLRIVAATCQDLPTLVYERRFREDLYHRIAGITFTVPPLRDRVEDIVPLLRRFLSESEGSGREVPIETVHYLEHQSWRGNVRELRQAVRRAVVLGGDRLLPEDFALSDAPAPAPCERAPTLTTIGQLTGRRWIDIERDILSWAIAHYGGIRPAAAALGRPRSTIYDRAVRYGLGTNSSRRQ